MGQGVWWGENGHRYTSTTIKKAIKKNSWQLEFRKYRRLLCASDYGSLRESISQLVNGFYFS